MGPRWFRDGAFSPPPPESADAPSPTTEQGERPQEVYCVAARVCLKPPSMFLTFVRFVTATGTSLPALLPEAPLPS